MSGSIRLSFEASPAALRLADVTTVQFATNAGLAIDDAERVQRAVQIFVAFSVHHSYKDVTGGEIELRLDLEPNGVKVAVQDWGRPWRRGGGSFGPLPSELAEAAELDPDAQLDNLADEGKLLTLRIPCTHDANAKLATAPTKPARIPKQLDHHSEDEVEVRLATAEDADAICELLYDNYGLDYVHAEFYRPVIIAIGIERGILASTVAYAGDELVGHIALFGSGPMSTMGSGEAPEMAAALIAEEWRGLWLYNRLHDFAVAHASSLGMSAVFGQSTTAHVVSQRLGVGSGYQFTAVMIGGTPPTMAKGQTKRGAQVSARGGLAYAVLPLAASPVLTATLPEQYAAVLRRIAEEAGYAIVAPDGADPAGVEDAPIYWKQAGSEFVYVSGQHDLRAVEREFWAEDARRAETLYVDLDLTFDCSDAIEMLRDRGFYLSGLIPAGRNGRDWVRMQRPQAAADIDGIRLLPEARWLLDEVLADRASVT